MKLRRNLTRLLAKPRGGTAVWLVAFAGIGPWLDQAGMAAPPSSRSETTVSPAEATAQPGSRLTPSVAASTELGVTSTFAPNSQVQTFQLEFPPHMLTGETVKPVVSGLALSSDGKLLAAGGDDHQIHVWNLESGKYLKTLSGHTDWVRSVLFLPGAEHLVSTGDDSVVRMWDVTSGVQIKSWPFPGASATTLACAQGGKIFAGGAFDHAVMFDVDAARGYSQVKVPCVDLRALVTSPSGKWLAAAGRNGVVQVWQVGDEGIPFHFRAATRRIRALLFCGEDKLLVASEAGGVELVNAQTGKMLREFHDGRERVFCLAQLNQELFAGGGTDNTIRIWNVNTGEKVATLTGHGGTVTSLVYSEPLNALFSASFDTTVRVWRFTQPESTNRAISHPANPGVVPSTPPEHESPQPAGRARQPEDPSPPPPESLGQSPVARMQSTKQAIRSQATDSQKP